MEGESGGCRNANLKVAARSSLCRQCKWCVSRLLKERGVASLMARRRGRGVGYFFPVVVCRDPCQQELLCNLDEMSRYLEIWFVIPELSNFAFRRHMR